MIRPSFPTGTAQSAKLDGDLCPVDLAAAPSKLNSCLFKFLSFFLLSSALKLAGRVFFLTVLFRASGDVEWEGKRTVTGRYGSPWTFVRRHICLCLGRKWPRTRKNFFKNNSSTTLPYKKCLRIDLIDFTLPKNRQLPCFVSLSKSWLITDIFDSWFCAQGLVELLVVNSCG